MYITTRYAGIKRDKMNYLFFLLTEDYIEDNRRIAEGLGPLLNKFARDLGEKGALVKPFPGDEETTLGNALEGKSWTSEQIMMMRQSLPALLIIDLDFDDFDPTSSKYIYISLRRAIDKYGNVNIFELQDLLDLLVSASDHVDLFREAHQYIGEEDRRMIEEATEVKPSFFGINFDLKRGIDFLRQTIERRKLYRS